MFILKCVRRHRRTRRSRAAAIVEFAVVLPLLLTILFGIIEYGWLFMVRQTLQNAAREGCRVAILKSTSEPYSEVTDRVNQVMLATGLAVDIDMSHATNADPVETVTVSVPMSEVSLMGNFFGERTGNLTGSCSMRKEGMEDA